MRKLMTAILLSILSCSYAIADEFLLKDNVPERYIVKSGDTLWDIATLFLDDPWSWNKIWYLNPEINDPHLIFPGDELALIQVDGKTRLTAVTRSEEANTVTFTTENSEVLADGTIKLKPGVRYSSLDSAIKTIPREYVESFLTGNQVVTSKQIQDAGYIIAGEEGRIILGAGDSIFARANSWPEGVKSFEIFRPGEIYLDPQTEAFLGYEAVRIGRAQLDKLTADVAEMTIVESDQNARIGDRVMVLPNSERISSFYPSVPEEPISGEILAVTRGVTTIAQWDVVVLNRGEREGVEQGTVFEIMRQGDLVKDPIREELVRLPSQKAGRLMVFRVFDRMSYGLIMEATNTMKVGDQIVTPDIY